MACANPVDCRHKSEHPLRARPWLEQGLIRSAFVLALLSSACSPYEYAENVQGFSSKIASIDAAYQEGAKRIAAEKQTSDRLLWMRDRPVLVPGPGCTTTAGLVPCEVIAEDDEKTPQTIRARPQLAAPDINAPAAALTKGLTPPTRAALLRALDNYSEALAALTKAQDRAAFDNAAGKVSAAVGGLVQSMATLSGTGAAAAPVAGGIAKAASNAVLWLVGEDLDNRRLQQLRVSTAAAFEPIHTLAAVLGEVLGEQRGDRLDGLETLLVLKVQSANLAARAKGQVFGAAVDEAQAAAAAYETVRTANPQATARALIKAHDALVEAVRKDDGQFAALVADIEAFSEKAKDLIAAASASPAPAAPKS